MKALRRCRNKANNVVLIDVDTCSFNNVIVLDVPESLTTKRIGSTDKIRSSRTYIYIDDDESPINHHTGENVNGERNFENGASSSRRYGPDNITPVKLSKGKRTYSGRGFSAHSDSDSSDDDSPDCEFMEDFEGKVREQWEKASLKRKADAQNDHGATRDDTSASRLSGDADNGFGVNKNKHKRAQDSNFKGTSHEKKGESSNRDATVNVDGGGMPSVCEDQCTVETDDQVPYTSSEEENEKMDVENAPIIDDVIPDESCIIDQREKLKETDEYKLALEQELSARQLALKIQAEEAQQQRRVLKRKKAESMRILDMERRQKERVEEIRETQKKDEENMNLKEQYRTEVRLELKKLEITCLDVASLLRGLGVQVGSGPTPSSHEVRAAYKRALFSFHPDRASVGSDMRKQVEAEEKFKLISRMKEKLPL